MKKLILAFAIVLGLGVAGVAVQNSSPTCVELYVDYGPLNNGAVTNTCIPVDGETNALDLLASANLSTEGTQDYGNAILCRLAGFPDVAVETCEVMPSAESYWAVLVKEHGLIALPFDTGAVWGWAQTGINEVYLNPGDSLGLVFADNGEVELP
jgi:hypothetical protein